MIAWLYDPEVLCLLMFAITCLLLLAGFPVAFSLAGSALIFAWIGYALDIFDISFLSALPQRIFAVMTNDVLVAVPLFVFMGVMLERSRIAADLLENIAGLFGTMRGGLGYAVCVVGALLAASTGIVGATVVTMGLLALPTMLRYGYSPALACGSIAASGTLGQIIPPSIVLVLLGDQLSAAYQSAQLEQGIFAPATISVNDLFAGALLPGLLLVAMYMVYLGLIAWQRPVLMPAPDAADRQEPRRSGLQILIRLTGSLMAPVVLIVAVLGSILGGLATPTEAAALGAVGAVMLAGYRIGPRRGRLVLLGAICLGALLLLAVYYDLRLQRDTISARQWLPICAALVLAAGLAVGIASALIRTYRNRSEDGQRILVAVMRSSTTITSMIFVILIGASLFSLVFRGYGGDDVIAAHLQSLPGGAAMAVVVVMGVMFVLGFFLDFLEIVFIVVPIVAPVLLQMEIVGGELMNPVWLGIMMAMVLQTSFLTPPFGFALFYLRGVAPASISTLDIYRGVVPFIVIQLMALIILWYLPELATWLPEMLYG